MVRFPKAAYAFVSWSRGERAGLGGSRGGAGTPFPSVDETGDGFNDADMARRHESIKAGRDATGGAQRASLAKIARYYRAHLAICTNLQICDKGWLAPSSRSMPKS